MFRSLTRDPAPSVRLTINGKACTAAAGSTVWTAMALSNETTTRIAPVTEQPRSAYCAMGVCFECLVVIDGQPNRQACLTQVREGMQVNTQRIVEGSIAALPKELISTDGFDLAEEIARCDQL